MNVYSADAQEPHAAVLGPEVRTGIGLAYLDFNVAPAARQGLLELESEMSVDLLPRLGAEVEVYRVIYVPLAKYSYRAIWRELRSCVTRKSMSRMFHDQIGRQANELLGDFYDGYRRGGQAQARGQSGA
jgi:hypothetical protein